LQAYTQAAASLNLLRAFSTGGYADIHRVQSWISGFTDESDAKRYREIATQIPGRDGLHGGRRRDLGNRQ
jgi:3-deoxy-7-phosphoheptulonate synthase